MSSPEASLLWVYPSEGYTTAEASTFLVGYCNPKALSQCTLHDGQGNALSLTSHPDGYLSAQLPLSVGKQTFTLQTKDPQTAQSITLTLTLHRDAPMTCDQPHWWFPQLLTATAITGEHAPWMGTTVGQLCTLGVILPKQDPETTLVLQITPKASATRSSPRVVPLQRVSETTIAQNKALSGGIPIFGQWHQPTPHWGASTPHFVAAFSLPDPGQYRVTLCEQGLTGELFPLKQSNAFGAVALTVWETSPQALLQATPESLAEVPCRVAPSPHAQRLWPLCDQTPVRCVQAVYPNGQDTPEGAWVGIAPNTLQQQVSAWVAGTYLPLPHLWNNAAAAAATPQPLAEAQLVCKQSTDASSSRAEWAWEMPMSAPCWHSLNITPQVITLTVQDVTSWLTVAKCLPAANPTQAPMPLVSLHANTPDTLTITFTAPAGRLWRGASVYFCQERGLVCALALLPQHPTDWRILLDPGHGRDEWGAGLSSPNPVCDTPPFLPEKDANLRWAKECQLQLQAAGFTQVALTRETDVPLSLVERVEYVRALDADIVLSLHHNALPDGRDPLAVQGVGVYAYHPHSMSLGNVVLASLQTTPGVVVDALVYDSLTMTRLSAALSLLIELGYVTHPNDMARIIDPQYRQAVCTAIIEALQTFGG